MSDAEVPTSPVRPRTRWRVLTALLVSVMLMLALLVIAATAGVEVDGKPYRGVVSRWLSEQLGREARIDGPLNLTLGVRPRLLVRQLRLAQPAGFGTGNFLQVGELRFELDLLPLLRGQLRAERLSASGVRLDLRQRADGAANWTLASPTPTHAAPADRSEAGSADAARLAAHFDIRELRINDLQVTFHGQSEKPLSFALDSFDARLPADAGVIATGKGRVQQTLDYQLDLRGGSLRQLASAESPWPVQLQLAFAGSTLTLNGQIGAAKSELRFGLGTTDIARFGKLLDIDFPDAGVAGMAGLVTLAPGSVRIDQLSAQLGRSSMQGSLHIDGRQQRPRIDGALDIARLDLKPFMGQDDDDDEPADWPALYRSLSRARLDLSALQGVDARLRLSVDQWLSLPGDIRAAALALELADGRLRIPMKARIEGVPVHGQLKADAQASSVSIELQSEKSPVGGLAQMITGLPGIEGRLGRLSLRLGSQGRDGAALMRALSAHLQLDDSHLSYGNLDQGKPVGVYVSRLQIALDAGKPLEGAFRGTLLGKPLEAALSGTDLRSAMLGHDSRFSLVARSRGFAAQLQSSVDVAKGTGLLSFSLGAARASDVASWLGLRNDAQQPLALAGRITGSADDWRLTDMVLQAGRTSALVNVERRSAQKGDYYRASIEVSGADVAELDSLLAHAPPTTPEAGKRRQSNRLDIPLLPRPLVLDDADVRVRVHGVQGTAVALGEMGADLRLREGFMQSSPFFADIAGQRFEGALMIDTRSSEPHAQLWIFAKQLNAGQLMRDLRLAQGIDLTAASVSLYLDSRAHRLAGFIANAQVLGELASGQLTWRDASGKPAGRIRLDKGSLVAAPGQPVSLALLGDVDALPVNISLRSAAAKELLDPSRRVPFELTLAASNSLLSLTGTLDRNVEARDIELQMKASGDRLDTLDKLTRVALPPWGPWSVDGRLRVSRQGYAMQGMSLTLGSSTLQGEGTLDTSAAVPRLDLRLRSPQIQLDDFKLAGWSATDAPRPAPLDVALDQEALRRKATQTSDKVQGLLSRETLRTHQASLSVDVDRVLSGPDVLGGGRLKATIADGRATIAPVSLQMPGGSADLSLSYEPGERDVLADLKIHADRFDYGVLGRRLKPQSDLSGRFSLNVDVRSRAPSLSEVLRHGSGTLEFAVWPEDMKAGVFDLWAVNLFLALLPTIDPKNESRVNCAIGKFTVREGKLTQKKLVIDTSKVRVTGNTAIDLANERLHLRLQPQAKTAQFLSLATPLEVKGSLTDYSIGPNAGEVFETVLRMATSIIWVPIQRLFSEKVPEDGSDVCELR